MYPDNKLNRTTLPRYIPYGIVFSSRSPNISRSLMFLDQVQKNRDNYELFLYGIEGKHYIIQDGRLKIPDHVTFSNSRYSPWAGYTAFLNVEWDRMGKDNSGDLQFVRNNSQYPRHDGFYPDYSSIQTEADNRKNYIFSKIDGPLTTGSFMRENTEIVIEELKKIGTDRIIEVVQHQVDKWIAENKQ